MHCQLQLRKKINNQITYSDGIFNLVKESLFFHTIDMFRFIYEQRRVILIFLCFLAYYVLVASIAITFPQVTKCQSHETYETSGSSSFQSSNGISEDCAPAAMARCTDPLKVVTDNRDLGFATSMDELQEMCPYDIHIKEYYIDILNIFKHFY